MSNTEANISKIDAALAAAKARKAAKLGVNPTDIADVKVAKKSVTPVDKATKLSERDAKREAIKRDREERAAAKAAKKATKVVGKASHMSKVDKAAEKLPSITAQANEVLQNAIINLTSVELATLALHIQHYNRVKATERAVETKLAVGHTVTVIGGDPRYIGKVGVATKVQRIRCYVEVDGLNKPLYLFTSDVKVTTAALAPIEEEVTQSDADETGAPDDTSFNVDELEQDATGTDG